jgi:hypothetical protein
VVAGLEVVHAALPLRIRSRQQATDEFIRVRRGRKGLTAADAPKVRERNGRINDPLGRETA